MTSRALQLLIDRAAISDVLNRYALAVDTRNWALFRTCFTDDVEVDATSFFPGAIHHGVDRLVAATREAIEGLDVTQHMMSNHSHDIEGDTATCSSYLHAQHVAKNDFGDHAHTLGGYYNFDLVRIPGGWKIKKYRLTITWGRGNADVWRLAWKRAKTKKV